MDVVSRMRASGFLKGVLSVGSGNVLAQVIQVVTLPIVSRIFTDQMNGEYALVASVATIIVSFATLGLTSAVMTADSEEESDKVFQVAFLFEIIVSTLLVGIFFLVSPAIRIFTLSVNYELGLLLMLCYMLFANFSLLLYTAVNRQKNNKVLMLNPIIGAAMTLIVTIPMGLLGCGSVSLLIAATAAEILKSVQMLRCVNPFKSLIALGDIALISKKYKPFIVFQAPAHFLTALSTQIASPLFSGMFGAAVLGNYSMCMRLLEYPTRFVASPINTVYFRTADEYMKRGADLSGFTFKLIALVLAGTALPVAVLILWGEPIFLFVLGSGWEQAGQFASLLAFPIALKFCCTCISYCRIALARQKWNLVFCIINLLVTIASVGFGYYISQDLTFTVICYSIGLAVICLIDLGLSFHLMKKDFRRFVLLAVSALVFCFGCFALKGLMSCGQFGF